MSGPIAPDRFYPPAPIAPDRCFYPIPIVDHPSPQAVSSSTPASAVPCCAPGLFRSFKASPPLVAWAAYRRGANKQKPDPTWEPDHKALCTDFAAFLSANRTLFAPPEVAIDTTSTVWAGLPQMPQLREDGWPHPSLPYSPASCSDVQLLFSSFPIVNGEVQSEKNLDECLHQSLAYMIMSCFAIAGLLKTREHAPLVPFFFIPRSPSRIFLVFWFKIVLMQEPTSTPDTPQQEPTTVGLHLELDDHVDGPFSFAPANFIGGGGGHLPPELQPKPVHVLWPKLQRAIARLIDLKPPCTLCREIVPSVMLPLPAGARLVPPAVNRFRNLYQLVDGAYLKVVDDDQDSRLAANLVGYRDNYTRLFDIQLFNRPYAMIKMPFLGEPLSHFSLLHGDDPLQIARLMIRPVQNLLACRLCHGDLRPGNFLLRRSPMRIELIDFERCCNANFFYEAKYVADQFNPPPLPGATNAGVSLYQIGSCLLSVLPIPAIDRLVAKLRCHPRYLCINAVGAHKLLSEIFEDEADTPAAAKPVTAAAAAAP
ncbi:hypothetical protein PAPYR_7649 [Paratrimastix pyriformis]|uniref:Aminoglycoside phosphotransferase domain-containing protein n=1 Tax=Paratrimastix pyriformis TaxID=342808 RepID=A0ABQ8UFU9_9EUKA|nr:hypothetical protein PAPYR_7649 [Paratrimastix pyriformis]